LINSIENPISITNSIDLYEIPKCKSTSIKDSLISVKLEVYLPFNKNQLFFNKLNDLLNSNVEDLKEILAVR
jgi:hypothetical protein